MDRKHIEKHDRGREVDGEKNNDRGYWSGKLSFMLSCLGYSVGLGVVWRFPYLCYKNGGAVFIIPYFLMMVFVGTPMIFLEMALGQYTGCGPTLCWEMARLFKGVGIGMACVSLMIACYYNMIIGWAIFYLFASFTSDLPWQHCGQEWNTQWCALNMNTSIKGPDSCEMIGLYPADDGVCYNVSSSLPAAIYNTSLAAAYNLSVVAPSEEYLKHYVWGTNEAQGVQDLGSIKWQLVLCLFLSSLVVFVSLIKGVKSSGKVVYFTAIFPYVVLGVLMVVGVRLDGADKGITFYIQSPDLYKLKDLQVWKDAATQVFFSLGISWGGLVTLASYNDFNNNILRDSFVISIGNCVTCFLSGIAVFSYLGFLANEYNSSIEDVVDSGVGLAFIVYPEVITRLPVSPLWAIFFFLMIINMGLDTQFVLVQTVITSLTDLFPKLRTWKIRVVFITISIIFFLGLILCTNGGSWIVSLVDYYLMGWNMLIIALLECVSIMVYGPFRFKTDIAAMLNSDTCGCVSWRICFIWWMINLCFICPIILMFVMIFWMVDYTPYETSQYTYPEWANILGWLFAISGISPIVVTPVVLLYRQHGSLSQRLKMLTNPTKDWGPKLQKPQNRINSISSKMEEIPK